MSNLCIIPARGGSKRIPKKNIKEFLGKPIIAYSIELAIESKLFDEIIVSTEDEEIALIAEGFGANVPFFRSAELADDYATIADVIDDVKISFGKLKKNFDFICCLLPTSPLLTISNLKKGFNVLNDQEADSVMPVVRFSYPIQRAVKMNNGNIEMFFPEYKTARSQDLEKSYHDVGQFYWMKYSCGLRGQYKVGFEIPEMQVQDIDTLDDWKLAELKYRLSKEV